MGLDKNVNKCNEKRATKQRRRNSRTPSKKRSARKQNVRPTTERSANSSAPRATSSTLALGKARKAYDNAKYRCGKLPGYENTLFLIPSFSALIAAIGLPRSEQSLDRIDPSGHYELSNVRWASRQVQAANKRGRSGASVPTVDQYVAQAQASHISGRHRSLIAELWRGTCDRLARVPSTADIRGLAQQLSMPAAPEDSFDDHDIPRFDLPPGVFHLPSLTRPGAYVRVRGGPFPAFQNSKEGEMHTRERRKRWAQHGIIGTFDKVELRANYLEHELIELQEDLKGLGACWLGQPSQQSLLGGWFEGKMLAAAGRLTALGMNAAVLPAVRAAADFEDYFSAACELKRAGIQSDFLFVPDLQVDQGGAWRSDRKQLFALMRLVKLRHDHGRFTAFGVQNLSKLPIEVREYALGHFPVREFNAQ